MATNEWWDRADIDFPESRAMETFKAEKITIAAIGQIVNEVCEKAYFLGPVGSFVLQHLMEQFGEYPTENLDDLIRHLREVMETIAGHIDDPTL